MQDFGLKMERIKLHNPLVRRQGSSLSPSSSPCWSSGNHSRRLYQKTNEGFDWKINLEMAELLGALSCTAWAGLTGEHKQRTLPSLWWSLLAATGLLEGNTLQLLLYWLSSGNKQVLMLCKFGAVTTSHFMWNEIFNGFARTCYLPKPCLSLSSIFQSFLSLSVLL